MEALPNMPMMAPQFRTSTMSYDNIPRFDWRIRMKEYILVHFQADPHEYDDAMDELGQLKYEATIPTASVEQMCKMKRYYGQLCMMQKRFPMHVGGELETPFAWNDGLVDMRNAGSEVTINDIEFEKASVMFNIGACHAQYAADQPRDTQDSIKAAFMHFQYAAYAFEQLNTFRNSEIFYPSVDLDANVISFYYKVLIAQAQECLVQKSLLDNRSPIVIAKLSLWLQETFDSAAKIVDEWTINVPESLQRYCERLCRLKSDMYGVIAYMSLGDHSEKEERKMGWRLQYYNIALKYMHNVQVDRKMKERFPEMIVTAGFLYDVISAKQKNAEKENDFIYHDIVPKEEDAMDAAKKDGAMCKVRTLSFDPLDASVCGEDLFASLLPATVIDANKKYEAQKTELYTKIREQARSVDEQLDEVLQKADFDRLRFMLNEGKNAEAMFEMPEELMKRNADMTAYPDCIPNLLEKLRESTDTSRIAEAKLNTLIAKLKGIDLPRFKTDEGYILISKELDKLAEHLALAKTNNVSLNKAIAAHSGNLQVLSLPCEEMWRKLVPERENRGEMSKEEVQVRRMIEKIVEMKSQRYKLFEQLAAELKADDLSKKLIGTNEQGAEEIRNGEIGKHAKTQQLIRLNLDAQPTILKAFADANADFCEERMALQSAKRDYEGRVLELIGSYDVYRDVERKCEEGNTFYKQLMARCDQFAVPIHVMEEQYRAEAEKKERAQKEAEQHMQQLRMSREAQNAMMDFGGGSRHSPMNLPAPGAPGASGAIGPAGSRAPRLGDYLESYRARKQNPQVQIPQHINQEPDELGGPPSPTPSSVCDYPVSQRGSRTMQASPRFPPPAHGALQYPPPAQGYTPYPYTAQTPYQPPGAQNFPGYQGYGAVRGSPSFQAPPQSFGGPGAAPGSQNYQQPAPQTPRGFPAQIQAPSSQGFQQPAPQVSSAHQMPQQSYGGAPGAPQNFPAQNQAPSSQGFQQPAQQVNSAHQMPPRGFGGAPGAQGFPSQQPNLAHQAIPQSFPAPNQVPGPQSYQQPAPHDFGANNGAPTQFSAPQSFSIQNQLPGAQSYQQPAQQVSSTHQALPQSFGGAPGAPQSFSAPGGAPGAQQSFPAQNQLPGAQSYQQPNPAQQAPPQGFGSAPGAPQNFPTQNQLPGAQSYQQPTQQVNPAHQIPQQNFGANHGAPNQFSAPGAPQSFQAQQAPPKMFGATGVPASFPAQNPAPQGFGPVSGAPGAPGPQQSFPAQKQAPGSQGFGSNHGAPGVVMGSQTAPGAPTSFSAQNQAPGSQGFQQPAPQTFPVQNQPAQGKPAQFPAPGAPTSNPPTQRFQPLPGAPSPWHATPAELKTPWNTTPQYHPQQNSSQPSQQPQQQQQQSAVPPTRSNVDLLSDLLGDFNLPPPIQPTVQSTQNLQAQPIQQDFRPAPVQPDPGKPRLPPPTVAVPPMPQQGVAPEPQVQNSNETPILVKREAMNLNDLVDPSKFELGIGNQQKLEKRMLHHSIRTNGAPPPLNQSDPLNQIDAFSFAIRNSLQK